MLTELLILFATVLLILKYLTPKKDKDLPPGPIQWPIIGNIFEMALADATYPHIAMVKLAEKYGDVMSIKLGTHDGVVVTSYEAFKELFTLEELQTRYILPFVTDRAFNKLLGIIWSNGEMWKCIRKFSIKGMREFGFNKSHHMENMIQEEVRDMMKFLKNSSEKNNGVIDINPHDFAASSVNILWGMVSGYKFRIGCKTLQEILEHGNSISAVTSQSNIYNAFPKLRHWFPKLTSWDKHMKSHKEYQQFVHKMIEKSREDRASRADPEAQNFIEVFLDEIDKNIDNPDTYFTEEQLIVVLQDLFLAGTETTGTALVWTILFFVLNPRVQEKLRDEVNNTFALGQEISIGELKKLPYLKATLFEIFRMADLVPSLSPRMASETIFYKNYKIPKGTLVIASMHKILNEEAYWGDPQTFRPERFLDSSGTQLENFERANVFGMGKRICMGESLVWEAMSLYLAEMLRNFKIETIQGKEPTPLNPVYTSTLTPQRFSVKFNVIK